ncbi:MAG: 5'-nucleotidase C-terminal domain-containing protein [Bacteroidales bacterium]
MKIIKATILVCLLCEFSLFAQNPLELQSVKRTRFALTSKYDSLANPKTVALIERYKSQMAKQMNEVIGVAPMELAGGIPESPLLNLTADVLREAGSKFTPTRVDLGLMNDGGLRNTIRSGNVTVGNIFEVYPFDNQLVVLYIKGKDLRDLFGYIAKIGGAGVSGVTLKIKNGAIAELFIGASELNDERIYTVATIDYLADGNDGAIALKQATTRKYTGLLLRDVMMDFIKNSTKVGKAIEAKMDGRISIQK